MPPHSKDSTHKKQHDLKVNIHDFHKLLAYLRISPIKIKQIFAPYIKFISNQYFLKEPTVTVIVSNLINGMKIEEVTMN